jgi:hypothetical protein
MSVDVQQWQIRSYQNSFFFIEKLVLHKVLVAISKTGHRLSMKIIRTVRELCCLLGTRQRGG